MPIVKFGRGLRVINFTAPYFYPQEYRDNFGTRLSRMTQVAGMDGGIDEFGTGSSPAQPGRITQRFRMTAPSMATVTDIRDMVRKIANWGLMRLVFQPSDVTDNQRWCWARVVSVQMDETPQDWNGYPTEVTVEWEVPDPRWYSKTGVWFYDDGNTFDDGLSFGGATSISKAANATQSITNLGTSPTPVRIAIKRTGAVVWTAASPLTLQLPEATLEDIGATVNGVGIRQLNEEGHLVGEWFWNDTLDLNETLVVSGYDLAVRHEATTGDVTGYNVFYPTRGMGFLTLEPGVNTFQIIGTFSGTLDLTIDYRDGWV